MEGGKTRIYKQNLSRLIRLPDFFGITDSSGLIPLSQIRDNGVLNNGKINLISGTSRWEEDGDGLVNTRNFVCQFTPMIESNKPTPFGPDVEWTIHFENIYYEYDNEEYRQELLNGKYKGQTDIMFTPEEAQKLTCTETVAEGIWDFTFTFTESTDGVELLAAPVTVKAYAFRQGEEIWDVQESYEDVTITSFQLNSLSAVIYYESDASVNFTDLKDEKIFAVMHDGSRVELLDSGGGWIGYSTLDAASPIVVEAVDHILMADGTILPMPD